MKTDFVEKQERPRTEAELLLPQLKWGTLLDAIYKLIAQEPDGDRLLPRVVDSLRYPLHKSNDETKRVYNHAVSTLKQLGEQGQLKTEGFHAETGFRSPVTENEWRSRFIDPLGNKLINPLSGTRETYPWITDIQIDLESVTALSNSPESGVNATERAEVSLATVLPDYQKPVMNVTEPVEISLVTIIPPPITVAPNAKAAAHIVSLTDRKKKSTKRPNDEHIKTRLEAVGLPVDGGGKNGKELLRVIWSVPDEKADKSRLRAIRRYRERLKKRRLPS